MSPEFNFFATCPRYIEQLLAEELESLGIEGSKEAIGGVYFSTTQQRAYRVCLWSRLANRVLLQLATVSVRNTDDVYAAASAINWREHILASEHETSTLVVDFNGTSSSIRNTQFGAQLVKDAIVDQFSSADRPSISKQSPDIRINAHLAKGKITIALDVSGDSLHRRAYRTGGGEAPLKENLAAAILIRAGWPSYVAAAEQPAVLLDPMCGSGTLLFEAAMMAYDCAPGLLREYWGFTAWKQHDQAAWASILTEAEQRLRAAQVEPRAIFLGYDKDKNVLAHAQKTAGRLGLEEHFEWNVSAVEQLQKPAQYATGMLVSNPPYGERLGEVRALENLYSTFGGHLKQYFAGWPVAIYSANTELLDELRLRANKKYRLRNGALEGQLRLYSIAAPVLNPEGAEGDVSPSRANAREPLRLSEPKIVDELANRLKKNQQRLKKAAKKIDSDCYRLYDADLPEYSSAIDVYADHVLVTEYTAPDSIDEKKARQRFQNTLATVASVLAVDNRKLIAKQKRRQKGPDQYQRQGRGGELLEVREGQARLLVNLHDYHDTGLFLDHRPVRRLLAQKARGKRFLNLFCYTAAATVQVALAGASESTSVDMSGPYIEWARKNMQRNKINPYGHQFVQADCLKWLADAFEQQHAYDLILLDPPSFSNSKRMDDVLDIQRDHGALIDRCVNLLAPGGELVFSTNRRKFKMDDDLAADFLFEDVTQSTLDADFQRGAAAHKCWIIKAKTE